MATRDEKELDEIVTVHLAALLSEDAKGTPAKAAGLEALMRRAETVLKEKKVRNYSPPLALLMFVFRF